MKTRIVVYKNELGEYRYYPQRKILFFWKTFTHLEVCMDSCWTEKDIFNELDKAKAFIDEKLKEEEIARKSVYKKTDTIKYP